MLVSGLGLDGHEVPYECGEWTRSRRTRGALRMLVSGLGLDGHEVPYECW